MPNYRRAKFEGGYYFFTVVTYQRRKLFTEELARECLRQAIDRTRNARPFEIIAFCLLPEHLHCVWKLPEDSADFSTRWASVKGLFSREYCRLKDHQDQANFSRERKGEVDIWQRRFWEHQIRDEDDLQRHVDYIHYNPVKHGLVTEVQNWPWSTYHRYLKQGFYSGPDLFDELQAINEGYTFGE
jgi:putative transposase